MGSSETGGGVVDCSVGSIVWVRRRNGSWWPGKILDPDELTSSLITSPRSGTPVRLLGREDASVDWYNLEKSKRVKSFRCGEFDNCIERAEAVQGMPPKKREKYARREDAIMHAIELEKQILEKKYGKMGNSCNVRSRRMSPDAVTSSEYLGNRSGNRNDPRSDHLPQSARDQNPYEERVREGNQLSGDDDSAGALPRMRGLRDLGLLTVPPAREELSVVAFRTKRIRNAYLPYDSGEYLIDDQTLSSQLEIPVSKIEEGRDYPADMGEYHVSGSTEDTQTDPSETDSLQSDSIALSDDSSPMELQPKYPRGAKAREDHASMSSSDEFDDPTSSWVSKRQPKRKSNNPNKANPEASGNYLNDRNGFESAGGSYKNHISMVMEVDLKVEANNYRRDVPMISLMSKLNGHAIVGHPIPIEALESATGYLSLPIQLDSAWRTSRRRANSRVPRMFDSHEKTKEVSSLGVIKSGNVAATVACLPVNLVFSRLHEELGGRHQ